MSNRDAKKWHERWLLDKFRECYPVPKGTIDAAHEKPDIVIHTPRNRVGIEVTEIHHDKVIAGSRTQAQAGEREAVMDLMESSLKDRGAPPIAVYLHLTLPSRPQPGSRRDLATRLADYVIRSLPAIDEDFHRDYWEWLADHHLPPEIYSITIMRRRCLTSITCHAPAAEFMPDMLPRYLEQVITEKNRRVRDYRKRCDEAWLLLCIETGSLATGFSIESFSPAPTIVAKFDKVFLFSVMDRWVHEFACRT